MNQSNNLSISTLIGSNYRFCHLKNHNIELHKPKSKTVPYNYYDGKIPFKYNPSRFIDFTPQGPIIILLKRRHHIIEN